MWFVLLSLSPIAGTPYEGGLFKMKLVLGKDFPASPPQGKCTLVVDLPPLVVNMHALSHTLSHTHALTHTHTHTHTHAHIHTHTHTHTHMHPCTHTQWII